MGRSTYTLTAGSSADRLREAIPEGFRLGTARDERLRRTWVDTFDWRLWRRELSAFVVSEGPRSFDLVVRDGGGGELRQRLEAEPGLAAELPAGPVRDLVAPAISIRRLLERVTVTTRRSLAPLLDQREKTIGSIAIEERAAQAPGSRQRTEMSRRVVITALRGFDREVRSTAKALVKAGVLKPEYRREISLALAAVGRSAGDYSSKLTFDLSAIMPASKALADILEHLADTMTLNEQGVAARLDVEFLHDYRVAVRRTRSALSHFGDLLAPADLRWAAGFFKDLGRRTGAARDLDVLLFELPDYAHQLPSRQGKALSAMAARFEDDVAREYATFARWLDSKTYRSGLERWRRVIARLHEMEGGPTMGAMAAEAIEATAAKVFKQARKIHRTDDDDPVHRLRIRCKKLRYVLEFSRSLSPGGEVAKLITVLKRAQDVLGTFNDLVVHQPRILETAQREPVDPELLVATGQLLAELDQRYRAVRLEVDGVVRRFERQAPPQLERVKKLLVGGRR